MKPGTVREYDSAVKSASGRCRAKSPRGSRLHAAAAALAGKIDSFILYGMRMNATPLAWLLLLGFPISEIALAVFKRARLGQTENRDRGSLPWLWIAIALGIALAIGTQSIAAGRLPVDYTVLHLLAPSVMAFGLALRWWAIITLGRFFTVDVAIHRDHQIVRTGPYRFVRHPSYSGLVFAFLGLGLLLGNWISVLVLMVPIVVALAARIAVEERALHAAFGADYAEYAAHTKRLVPGLY
jgi:protein-S-isoprenylcysteine O-methyltransferase